MTAYDNLCNNVETISETVTFAGEVVSIADVPNVFTPNGDGQNDILKIMSIDPNADFSMTIFNRWGKKVFVSETNGDFWDGSSRLGGESHAGTYYYEVIYRDICTDEDKLKTGYVQLMRE
jgi:gliding motility-associated-like protein